MRWPLRTSADPKFWERHLGTDALCTMWFMSVLATGMEGGVLVLANIWPTTRMWCAARGRRSPPPRATPRASPAHPPRARDGRFLLVDGFFLVVAMWLMLSAAYPENFNTFALFPKTRSWLAKRCFDKPCNATPRKNSGVLQRQNSNSRVFV